MQGPTTARAAAEGRAATEARAAAEGPSADELIACRVAADPRQVRDAQDLRVRVFCGEQGVARAAELDGRDADAIHIVALEDERVVGTCRLLFEPSGFRIGRMAVEAERRRNGIGTALLEAAEREASRWGGREVVMHAQTAVEGLYARAGYAAEGGTFLEDGIEHVRMHKELQEPGA